MERKEGGKVLDSSLFCIFRIPRSGENKGTFEEHRNQSHSGINE